MIGAGKNEVLPIIYKRKRATLTRPPNRGGFTSIALMMHFSKLLFDF